MNSLIDCRKGDVFKIVCLNGDYKTNTRLEALGFCEDVEVIIISKNISGIIINVLESRIALSNEVGSLIIGEVKDKKLIKKLINEVYNDD